VEPAKKQQYWETNQEHGLPPGFQRPERPIPEWETKLGKMIFYITCALGLWFFYWLNGIQCPC
jgi:hypothetical protein